MMGLFGKLMFWKHEGAEEFGLGPEPGLEKSPGMGLGGPGEGHEMGLPGEKSPGPEFGLGPEPGLEKSPGMGLGEPEPGGSLSPEPAVPSAIEAQRMPLLEPVKPEPAPSFAQPSAYASDKHLELISAKIDALKAAIDSMNQRLINIESIAKREQEKGKVW